MIASAQADGHDDHRFTAQPGRHILAHLRRRTRDLPVRRKQRA